jgi:hypothetical protein
MADHQTQVREHQLPRRVEVAVVAEAGRQAKLFLLGQQRKLSRRLDVGVNAAGCRNRRKSQGLSHVAEPPADYGARQATSRRDAGKDQNGAEKRFSWRLDFERRAGSARPAITSSLLKSSKREAGND